VSARASPPESSQEEEARATRWTALPPTSTRRRAGQHRSADRPHRRGRARDPGAGARRKNNPLLVGEAGVGKTAIAEGWRSSSSTARCRRCSPAPCLRPGPRLAARRHQVSRRFREALEGPAGGAQAPRGRVLFIDEIHTIIGAGAASGGVMDASNLLKPLLTSGKLRCIGSTTFQEYRGIFDKDKALSRRFQKIDVIEPTVEDAYKILKGLKSRFEEHHHGLRYTDQALRVAAELSGKLHQRPLPARQGDRCHRRGRCAQQLQPPSKRKKEHRASTMSRRSSRRSRGSRRRGQPQRQGSPAEAREQPQDGRLRPGRGRRAAVHAIKMARAGLRAATSRSAPSCSPAPPAWARPRSRAARQASSGSS
jgi:ATP-dependent Clp protease ATP-binding subunit ClpA